MPNQSQKLSQLAAIPSVATTDMVYLVSTTGGVLTGYRATVSQITATLGGLALGGTIGGSPTTGDILVVGAGGVLAQAATIPGSQVAGDIGGNAAGITGTIAESQVVGLMADLTARALDATVVHTSGDETIAGIKSFTTKIVAPIVDAATTYDATNRGATTLPAGAPVAVHGSGIGVVAANASATATAAVGLLAASVAPSAVGPVAISGPLTLADWTAAAGTATLAPRAIYYLDAAPGRITATPPDVVGQVVQAVGVAVDPTTLDIRIAPTILL